MYRKRRIKQKYEELIKLNKNKKVKKLVKKRKKKNKIEKNRKYTENDGLSKNMGN